MLNQGSVAQPSNVPHKATTERIGSRQEMTRRITAMILRLPTEVVMGASGTKGWP